MLTISGLNARQGFFCELLWGMSNGEDIVTFLALLTNRDREMCETLIEMMRLSFSDAIDSTDEATEVLDYIRTWK